VEFTSHNYLLTEPKCFIKLGEMSPGHDKLALWNGDVAILLMETEFFMCMPWRSKSPKDGGTSSLTDIIHPGIFPAADTARDKAETQLMLLAK
jgi:hypothetical protein